MKTIMAAKTPNDSSLSFSRRYFNWKMKKPSDDSDHDDEEEILTAFGQSEEDDSNNNELMKTEEPIRKKKKQAKLVRSVMAIFRPSGGGSGRLGTKVTGTLFGYRRGHVRLAFQEDPSRAPAFLVELATTTSMLVREMASGTVRVALECEKRRGGSSSGGKLVEEGSWRTYCNGRKCGLAARRECGSEEWKVLRAVEPISMGAGVLPGGHQGEMMYMRARFERVVGSKDSEAFYMMSPDGAGGPELSIYLLRV